MGKVLGIVNRKGGVGKTTTATTLSYLLSKEGCKVALIDFDGQRHTTKLCGVTAPEQLSVTIYDILKCIVMNEELPDKGSYMIKTETGVDLIPANNKLDNFDIFISSGEVSVLIQENESGEPKLVLDATPYEKTKRIYEGLQRMGERLADQMEEADAEEREGEQDWER